MAYLINGNGFSPVTAQEDADLYGGILGLPLTVLKVGNQMAATVVDNNTIRIGDGEAVVQGRRIHNDPGMYDTFTIPTGSQGVTAWYIIGYLLHTDTSTGNEVADTFVRKMNTAEETITEAVLRDGASEAYISMYRVTLNGINVQSVDPLYSVVQTAQERDAAISELNSKSAFEEVDAQITSPYTVRQQHVAVRGDLVFMQVVVNNNGNNFTQGRVNPLFRIGNSNLVPKWPVIQISSSSNGINSYVNRQTGIYVGQGQDFLIADNYFHSDVKEILVNIMYLIN